MTQLSATDCGIFKEKLFHMWISRLSISFDVPSIIIITMPAAHHFLECVCHAVSKGDIKGQMIPSALYSLKQGVERSMQQLRGEKMLRAEYYCASTPVDMLFRDIIWTGNI